MMTDMLKKGGDPAQIINLLKNMQRSQIFVMVVVIFNLFKNQEQKNDIIVIWKIKNT